MDGEETRVALSAWCGGISCLLLYLYFKRMRTLHKAALGVSTLLLGLYVLYLLTNET